MSSATKPEPVPENAAANLASAIDAGLHYVSDHDPGIARLGRRIPFTYRDASGHLVDAHTKARIKALAIPPAWTGVWISADARGHLQATGRDARGRKQYRYHAEWSAARGAAKFEHLSAFGLALPSIRARVRADLAARPLSRTWLLATVVCMLEASVARIGNDEYRRANGSYGLTTLLDRHVHIHAHSLTLTFKAKSGITQAVRIDDVALARRVRRCQDLPGQTLFQYVDDDGHAHRIGSDDVNEYLRDASGGAFTAKDFRTWVGTLATAEALSKNRDRPTSKAALNRSIVRALDEAAQKLGNTRAVCRRSYVHPAIIESYLNGRTLSDVAARGPKGLGATERRLLALLRR